MRRPIRSAAALAVLLVLLEACAVKPRTPRSDLLAPMEGLPPPRWRQMETYRAALDTVPGVAGMTPQAVVALYRRWAPGSRVRVAFRGGSRDLHRRIERAVAIWTEAANLRLDFGYDAQRDAYRSWSANDRQPAAEIRISFDAAGYWSCIGRDSLVDACAGPGQASMNLQGFDGELPSRWTSVVLHQFGHALGFGHEHRNPPGGCEAEFRWSDDAGYVATADVWGQRIPDPEGRKPGIFTVLGGPLNYWDRAAVERNVRYLADSSAFDTGAFDRDSIMRHEFPEWQFIRGRQSRCYNTRNETLSPLDFLRADRIYPRDVEAIRKNNIRRAAAIAAVAMRLPQ